MGIGLVGYQHVTGPMAASTVVDFALVGGDPAIAAATPSAGDTVYILVGAAAQGTTTGGAFDASPSYATIGGQGRRDDVRDALGAILRRRLTTAETTVEITQGNVWAGGTISALIVVLRGVHATTPEGANTGWQGSINARDPNPGAVTTTGPNSWVLGVGTSTWGSDTDRNFTFPALVAPAGASALYELQECSGGKGIVGANAWAGTGVQIYEAAASGTSVDFGAWSAAGNADDSRLMFTLEVMWDGVYSVPAGGSTGTASGSLPLSGTATGAAPSQAQGSGDLGLSGSAQGQAPTTGAGAGSLPLSGAGSGTAATPSSTGAASGGLGLSGTAQGQAPAQGAGAGALGLGGQASGVAPASGQGAGSALLGGAGSGAIPAAGQGAGALPLGGGGTGAAPAQGQATGSLGLSGSAQGAGSPAGAATGTGAGTLDLSGSGQGTSPATGQGAGAAPLTGQGSGAAPASAEGAGDLGASGQGAGQAPAAGTGAGAMPLQGTATGSTVAPGEVVADFEVEVRWRTRAGQGAWTARSASGAWAARAANARLAPPLSAEGAWHSLTATGTLR